MNHSIRVVLAAALFFLFTSLSVQAQTRTGARVPCEQGSADGYSCQGIDLLSVLSLEDLGSPFVSDDSVERFEVNDMWGWYHEGSGREFAIVGRQDGTSFVEVTDPLNPVLVGTLPASSRPSVWRDMKVHANHAFIVADGTGDHGMQVFDLTRLLTVTGEPLEFDMDAVYPGVDSAHNIFVNEESATAFIVGANGSGGCGPGLHMVDISDPVNPQLAGCFSDQAVGRGLNGYVHDVQCVMYDGPDSDYTGREICVGASETAVQIIDVTEKQNPSTISLGTYPNSSYVHQGWLDAEHRFYYQNDELDELTGGTSNTRTLVWDLTDLDDPVLAKEYLSTRSTVDHNNYVKGNFLVQSNYVAGLVMLDISERDDPSEVAFFDVHDQDRTVWDGSWSNYPYFRSGAIGVTSSIDGFFLLMPTIDGYAQATDVEEQPSAVQLFDVYPNPFDGEATVEFSVAETGPVRVGLYDLLGRELRTVFSDRVAAGEVRRMILSADSLPAGAYIVRLSGPTFSESSSVIIRR